jgi:DNA-binding response OmpR family regulator
LDNSNKTILIIDDEAHIRRILEMKFKNAGFKIITAKNGQEGFELIQSKTPDVIISDINMPQLNGKDLCKMINPMKKDRTFLTIIMTARIKADEEEWINTMTDTLFMEKPFSPSKVLEAVVLYLDGK